MAEQLLITLVYAPAPRQVLECALSVAAGSTVQDAIAASGWLQRYPELQQDAVSCGVWGQREPAPAQRQLQEGDRVELYRPLKVDPQRARRERFKGQGARTSGLFARKRAGAKAGYGG